MTRPRHVLDRRREADSGAVFLQGSAQPVFRGSVHEGAVDYVCAHCREGVLAESIVHGQLWNVVLLCWRCGGGSAAPRRPRGLPIGRRVVTPYNHTRAIVPAAPVDLPDGMVLASVECQVQRAAELADLSAPLMTEEKRTLEGPETFRQLLRRAHNVFGGLVKKHGRVDHDDVARSAADRHRLGYLLDRARASEEAYPNIDVLAMLELDVIVDLVEAWQRDPSWTSTRRRLVDPGEFAHAIIEIAAASTLIAIGNDIGRVLAGTGRRTADLMCVIDAMHALALELKVPRRLQWPSPVPLSGDEASALVDKALAAAGTGPRGQLSADWPGILVIGGFHLHGDDLQTLRDAALSSLRPDILHVAAVMVLSLGVHGSGLQEGRNLLEVPAGSQMGFAIFHLVALNPAYDGRIALRALDTPWLRELDVNGQAQILPG